MSQNKDIIAAVFRLSRMLRRHPVEKDALGRMSFHVLREVHEHDGIRVMELADRLEVRPASMAEVLNRLERDGYVTREKDPEDSRVRRVFITEKTRMQFQERARRHEAENGCLLACLTEEEADTFLAVCDTLCACLEKETPGGCHHQKEMDHESKLGE